MARSVAAAAELRSSSPADLVRDALRGRIGQERFDVWFGDSAWRLEADADGPRIVIRAGAGFTHEWLRRTFVSDVEGVARDVCGAVVRVEWEAAGSAVAAVAPLVPRIVPVDREPAPRSLAGRRPAAAGLEDFVAGPSNRMAVAAVEMVAARPGEISPLVIHGPSGVGKTHLLQAVCVRARELHPGIEAVCMSAEQFTTGFLQALHGGGLPGFRRTCRSAAILVIDDLQFFIGKRATVQELQQTVDALQRQGAQLVFGSDRDLDALGDLGPELLTRLRGGMNARVLSPDYEVRRGIVARLCALRGLPVPDEVVHHVATHMTRHARELIGAVNRLEATGHMLGVPVTLPLAEEALADLVRSSGRGLRLPDIERAVCSAFGIAAGALQAATRSRAASHARMLAMFLARRHTHAALTEIGGYFGRRSHSTVIAAQKTVAGWLAAREQVVLAGAAWDAEEAVRRVEDLLRAG